MTFVYPFPAIRVMLYINLRLTYLLTYFVPIPNPQPWEILDYIPIPIYS